MALQGFLGFPPSTWNWWTVGNLIPASGCLGAWQPKGSASLTDSYINLANPGAAAFPGVAPTFNPLVGWTFNGTTQYLLTRFFTYTNMSYCVRISGGDTSGSERCAFGGCYPNNPYDGVYFQSALNAGGGSHQYGNGALTSVASRLASGVFAATPTTAFRDGANDGTITNTMAHPGYTIAIGCLLLGNTLLQYFSGNIIALSLYNIALTDAQAIALSNVVALL